jgi:hypothetical protein
VLEDAALDPVVGFESGADGVWRRRGGKSRAIDEDGEGEVGDVRCGFGEVVCFWGRRHVRKLPGSGS